MKDLNKAPDLHCVFHVNRDGVPVWDCCGGTEKNAIETFNRQLRAFEYGRLTDDVVEVCRYYGGELRQSSMSNA